MQGDRSRDILIGIDAGTSVIKAVAFEATGRQIAVAATPNRYFTRASDGAAFQSMDETWVSCRETLVALAAKVPGLAARTLGIGVTAQGDGTWLVGAGNRPVTDGWIWLDARAAKVADRLRAGSGDPTRYYHTGTGLNVCQQSSQMVHIKETEPELLQAAEVAMHPKDWLYLMMTGVRATDPSEGCFTFGDFRTRSYSSEVIAALGLEAESRLLPPILDGTTNFHPLTAAAAAATGLREGTPVALGYVDFICTAMGAGLVTEVPSACTVIGSTGIHMRAMLSEAVRLNEDRSSWVVCLPVPGLVTMLQSNMASTLNIDWLFDVAADLIAEFGPAPDRKAMIDRIDGWMAATRPGALIYHPYISDAGERGPFINPAAKASLIGLNQRHRFPELVRAVIEGLGMAARDCYASIGDIPKIVRLSGGAARSPALRRVLSAALGASTQVSNREEAGAAGAAMIAAVSTGIYPDMHRCIADWVTPSLGAAEAPDPQLSSVYDRLYPPYLQARLALAPVWGALTSRQEP